MMVRPTRRRFLLGLTGAMLAGPLDLAAQSAGSRNYRIGFLSSTTAQGYSTRVAAFRRGLADLGLVDGNNLSFEFRWADGAHERLPGLASELVRANVDLIVAIGTPAARAAQRATATIPIVMVSVADPVGSGLVPSLARPGGNITGVTNFVGDTTRKLLDLLVAAVPKLTRVAVLLNPDNQSTALVLKSIDAASRSIGVHVIEAGARTPVEVDQAFALMARERAQAFLTLADPFLFDRRVQVTELAARMRIPAIYNSPEYVEAGGLMSYGVNTAEVHRSAAIQASKILRGAAPGEIPVEQPTQVELVLNLRAAREIGITIPQSILARAERVLE